MGQNMGQTVSRKIAENFSELFDDQNTRKSPKILRFQDFLWLRRRAIIHMYARADGEGAVCVCENLHDILPDDLRQVFVIPFFDAGLQHGSDRGRIDFGLAAAASRYNVFQLCLPDAQAIQFFLQFRHVQARQHGPDAVCDLGADLPQLCLLCGQVGGGAVDLVGDILGRFCEVQRPQVFLQVLHHKNLYFVGVYILRRAGVVPVFLATAIVPGHIALFIRGGVADVCAAAGFTFDQARQQVLVAGFIGCVPFVIVHSFLHLLPCFRVDDRRDGAFYPDDVGVWAAACPLPEQFALLFVPGVDAYVSFVPQDRVQGILPKGAPALSIDALKVIHDIVVAAPGSIPPENPPHDRGLCGVYDVLTGLDVVAQGRDATQEGTGLGLHGHAVDRLLPGAQDFGLAHANGQQLQEEVLAVGQVAQALTGGTDHADAQIHHGLSETEPVADVAAAAGDVIDHHGVKHSRLGGPDHILEAAPVGVGAAGAFILEGGHDLNVVSLAVFPDFLELVRDRVLCLAVGAVPRVFCCFQKIHFLFDCRYATIEGHKAPIF